jgi:hypothetical protein
MEEITNADVITAWSAYPQNLIEGFGDEGDFPPFARDAWSKHVWV